MKFSLSLFLLFFSMGACVAQSINAGMDTITWSAYADKNLLTNDQFTRASTFISYGVDHVDFVKELATRTFTVTSVEGTWEDTNLNGQLIYHVTLGDQEGIIVVGRDDDGLTLTLDFSASSPDGIHNKYMVDHITTH